MGYPLVLNHIHRHCQTTSLVPDRDTLKRVRLRLHCFLFGFACISLNLFFERIMAVVPISSWLRLVVIFAAVALLSFLCFQRLNASVRSGHDYDVYQHVFHQKLCSPKTAPIIRPEDSLPNCTSSKRFREAVTELSLAEKCMFEYNLTLSFEPTMGRLQLFPANMIRC